MSEDTTAPAPTMTAPAEPIATPASTTPDKPFEQALMDRIKNKPNVPRTDLKTLGDLPEVATPSGFEDVQTQEAEDFLKSLDGVEEKKESKKEKAVKEDKKESFSEDAFSLSDLDLDSESKPEPKQEAKAEKPKKGKEDNIAELRKKAEILELESKTKEEKLAEYQKKVQEMEALVEKTAFEKSPRFNEKYKNPLKESYEKAAKFAKEYGGNANLIDRALSLKGKERIDFIDDEFRSGAASAHFLTLVNETEQKQTDLQAALTDYRKTNQVLQEEEKKRKADTFDKVNRNFEKVYDHLARKIDFFRKGDDEDHNKAVDSRKEAARNIIMGKASRNDQMVAPFLAVIAKEAVSKMEKLEAELAKYKERAASDSAVQPRIKRSSKDDDGGDKKGKPRSALEAIRAQLR
jgi:hypothetical protein